MAGGPESKRLEVAALKLFHPTASPLLRKAAFSYYDTVSWGGEYLTGGGEKRRVGAKWDWLMKLKRKKEG
jgi:hypothetical protein